MQFYFFIVIFHLNLAHEIGQIYDWYSKGNKSNEEDIIDNFNKFIAKSVKKYESGEKLADRLEALLLASIILLDEERSTDYHVNQLGRIEYMDRKTGFPVISQGEKEKNQ